MQINFTFERETKNTVRYQAVTEHELDQPGIETIYVGKQAIRAAGLKSIPKSLTIDLTFGEP
jgi:hypothetical protein